MKHIKTEASPMSPFPGPAKRLITFQDAYNGAVSAMKPKLSMKRSLASEKTSSRHKNSMDDRSSSTENDDIESSPYGKASMRKTTSSLLFVGKLLRRLPTYKPNISAFEQALNLNDPNDLEKAKVILKKRKEWRNMQEINVLARAFESIQLFHEIKKGLEPVLYFRLFKELIYEEFDIGQFIFHVNDPPDKLYIILVGEVLILTPKEGLANSTMNEKMGQKPSASDNLFAGFSVINTMEKFQSFGEIALRNNTPRTASAVCKTPCELVSLDKKTFRSVLKAFFENQAAEKLEFMRKVPLFKGIPNHHLQGLLLHLHEKRLKKGEIIFPEGTKVDTLYIIKEGEVQALKRMDLKDLKDQLLESKCDSKEKLKEVLNLREMEKFKELNSSWARKFTLQNKKTQILFCMGRGESFGESGLISNWNDSDFTMLCKSLTAVLFTISHQKILENLRMLDSLGYRNIDSTMAKIKEQKSFFSKAYLTEGLLMKNMTSREKEDELYVIPDDDEKRMRNTPTIRNMKPENQAYELRNKAKYHYTTRYLPSNLLLTREIREDEDSEFEEFTLEKNLLKMFNPQWFNMRKVNSLSNDFIRGNKDFSQKSIRPFTEMVKGLENLTKKNMPDIILYKSLKVKDNKAQKIYQYCSEVLKSNKNNNRKKQRILREEEKTAKKEKTSVKNENVYNFCNVEKFKAPLKII